MSTVYGRVHVRLLRAVLSREPAGSCEMSKYGPRTWSSRVHAHQVCAAAFGHGLLIENADIPEQEDFFAEAVVDQ